MARLLIDTDVFIDHLRGHSQAQIYLKKKFESDDELYSSVITRAELLSGARDEGQAIQALLNRFHEIPIDAQLAEIAADYRKQYGPSHGLLLPDALIAASTKRSGCTLITCNVKHFPMRDIVVKKPYRKS